MTASGAARLCAEQNFVRSAALGCIKVPSGASKSEIPVYFSADSLGSAAVGAMHITCADESERECADAFQHGFVRYMLRH